MNSSASAFYEFGLLPEICIHSPIEDQYSKSYIPRETCDCGCKEWIDAEMDIIQPMEGFTFPKKKIHCCKNCNEVRLADHIGIK